MEEIENNQEQPELEFPENLEAIQQQRQGGNFKPAEQQDQFPGYEEYPAEEDVYSAAEIVPLAEEGEDLSRERNPDAWNETEDFTGEDLDVPGAELDDEDEMIGREDEENNYYSLGGDNHDNQDEGELG